MAEDKLSGGGGGEQTEKSVLAGLGDEDIRTSFYEGGLKSWECSVDLVRHLASDERAWPGVGRVLEVCFLAIQFTLGPNIRAVGVRDISPEFIPLPNRLTKEPKNRGCILPLYPRRL